MSRILGTKHEGGLRDCHWDPWRKHSVPTQVTFRWFGDKIKRRPHQNRRHLKDWITSNTTVRRHNENSWDSTEEVCDCRVMQTRKDVDSSSIQCQYRNHVDLVNKLTSNGRQNKNNEIDVLSIMQSPLGSKSLLRRSNWNWNRETCLYIFCVENKNMRFSIFLPFVLMLFVGLLAANKPVFFCVLKNRHAFFEKQDFGWQLWMFSWRADRHEEFDCLSWAEHGLLFPLHANEVRTVN